MKKIISLIVLCYMALGIASCINKKQISSNNQLNVPIAKNSYKSLSDFNGDTMAYIKENFVKGKEKYIGHEMSILLADLEMPILKYIPAIAPNLKEYFSIYFEFFKDIEIERKINKKENPVILTILLETPVPETIPAALARKNKMKWTKEEIEFWGKQKIKDLDIVNYNF